MGRVKWISIGFISISLISSASLFSSAGKTAFLHTERETVRVVLPSQPLPALVADYHGVADSAKPAENLPFGGSGGIREQVPDKYAPRYQHWKREFLATETGRQQWANYQNNPNF